MNDLIKQNQVQVLSQRLTECLTSNRGNLELLEIEANLNLNITLESRNLICNTNKKDALKQVFVIVQRFCNLINIKESMTEDQMIVLASDLCEMMKSETIEDVVLFFKKARQGHFGKIYRIDGLVVMEWVGKYLEEKAELRERHYYLDKKAKEVAEQKAAVSDEVARENLQKILDKLNKSEPKQAPAPQEPNYLNNKHSFLELLPETCKKLSTKEIKHQMLHCSYSMPEAYKIYENELKQRLK